MEEKIINNEKKINFINTEINLINKEPKKNIGGPDSYNTELIIPLMKEEEVKENGDRG